MPSARKSVPSRGRREGLYTRRDSRGSKGGANGRKEQGAPGISTTGTNGHEAEGAKMQRRQCAKAIGWWGSLKFYGAPWLPCFENGHRSLQNASKRYCKLLPTQGDPQNNRFGREGIDSSPSSSILALRPPAVTLSRRHPHQKIAGISQSKGETHFQCR